MPSQEPTGVPVRDVQPSGAGQGDRQPSVSDVLASCQAANAVSTPPDRSDSESAGAGIGAGAVANAGEDTEKPDGGPGESRPDAA